MIIDFICYIALLLMLLWIARVRPCTKVTLKCNGIPVAGEVLACNGGLASRVGLLNTPRLSSGDGLLLRRTKSIHTKGMHFPFDVIFLDETMRILRCDRSLQPGQEKVKGPKGTHAVLELGHGTIDAWLGDAKPYTQIEVTNA